jgi:hypothetical protein
MQLELEQTKLDQARRFSGSRAERETAERLGVARRAALILPARRRAKGVDGFVDVVGGVH